MQITVNDLIKEIIKKKKIAFIVFIISIIIYPIQYYSLNKDRYDITVVVNNYDNLSEGDIIQSKITNLFKQDIFKNFVKNNLLSHAFKKSETFTPIQVYIAWSSSPA